MIDYIYLLPKLNKWLIINISMNRIQCHFINNHRIHTFLLFLNFTPNHSSHSSTSALFPSILRAFSQPFSTFLPYLQTLLMSNLMDIDELVLSSAKYYIHSIIIAILLTTSPFSLISILLITLI